MLLKGLENIILKLIVVRLFHLKLNCLKFVAFRIHSERNRRMELIQRYVSKELTHFVGRHKPEYERFRLLMDIIQSGWILPGPFTNGQTYNVQLHETEKDLEKMILPQMVCFADIPINDLSLHMEKYSNFGIAFKKDYLVQYGANPVLYVTQNGQMEGKDVTREKWFLDHLKKYALLKEKIQTFGMQNGGKEINELFLEIDQFLMKDLFAYLKPFDSSKNDADEDNYYLEREWRIIGNLPFSQSNITRILIPEKYGRMLREYLPDYTGQISFTE